MVMGAIRPRWFLAGECGVPRMKEQEKTKEGLGKRGRKKLDPYYPSLTHVQVLLSSITCLPSYSICAVLSRIVVSNSLGSSVHGDSPGQNTGVGGHFLLQGIFPSQGLNSGLPHCRQILYRLTHRGRYLLYSSSTQFVYLIQSANDPQDPYPTCYILGIKMDQGLLFSSPLCWPHCSNSVSHSNNPFSLSFYHISENSFPTCVQTTAEKKRFQV